jgi:hypothetical protein
VELRDDADQALDCEELGAAQVELSLYQKEADALPLDRARWACQTDTNGVFFAVLRLAAGRYARGELRLYSAGGSPVRICDAQEVTRDGFPLEPLRIEPGVRHAVTVRVAGAPGRCAP